MTYTTIFSDASVKPNESASGWGCWIIKDGSSYCAGGPFKKFEHRVNLAELRGIAIAVSIAASNDMMTDGGTLMLQCDSMSALGYIIKYLGAEDRPKNGGQSVQRVNKVPAGAIPALRVIRAIAKEYSMKIVVRHVKGHKRTSTRGYVNALTDRLAGMGSRGLHYSGVGTKAYRTVQAGRELIGHKQRRAA